MAKRHEIFASRYFRAGDLAASGPVVVKIEAARLEQFKEQDGKTKTKLVLYFVGQPKALVVNMVNFDTIAALHGEDTDTWRGCWVELHADRTPLRGEVVDCVRAGPPPQAAMPLKKKPPLAPPPVPPDADDIPLDDEIPAFN